MTASSLPRDPQTRPAGHADALARILGLGTLLAALAGAGWGWLAILM